MAAAEELPPLTGVAWASAPSAAPAGWTVITETVEGAAANLGRGLGHKGGGFLCVSAGAEAAPEAVVADVQVLSDRSPVPAGYVRAREFPEPRPAGSRRKRLCVRLLPRAAAATAVVDIKLSGKSKAVPGYLRIGEIGSFAVWCKKGPVSNSIPPPVPTPRTVSLGLKQLSLQPADRDEKSPEKPVAPFGSKSASLTRHATVCDTSNIYGLSAMDGVPFTLHPKFESSINSGSSAILAALNVKSLAEIEKEYDYAFVVERTAAARLPPSIC
ncbi:multivesicular body subunit 12A isoform X2 [Dromaius novaehollandiae]|uniref:Multivesicular body subunit 12A n=1 Tax=Dromaius novaehollandiae TaxID=8790 RepID=A0A8C4J916_DRONO|nr:multivesicular body subunit 12A [Dromaius novaehollandiae]